jgi:hypothetical protein
VPVFIDLVNSTLHCQVVAQSNYGRIQVLREDVSLLNYLFKLSDTHVLFFARRRHLPNITHICLFESEEASFEGKVTLIVPQFLCAPLVAVKLVDTLGQMLV